MKTRKCEKVEIVDLKEVNRTIRLLGHGSDCAICSLDTFSRKEREKAMENIQRMNDAVPNSKIYKLAVKEIGNDFKEVGRRVYRFLTTKNEVERVLSTSKGAC